MQFAVKNLTIRMHGCGLSIVPLTSNTLFV